VKLRDRVLVQVQGHIGRAVNDTLVRVSLNVVILLFLRHGRSERCPMHSRSDSLNFAWITPRFRLNSVKGGVAGNKDHPPFDVECVDRKMLERSVKEAGFVMPSEDDWVERAEFEVGGETSQTSGHNGTGFIVMFVLESSPIRCITKTRLSGKGL
jgi:hypothetical protein